VKKFKTVSEYFESLPKDVRVKMENIRRIIKKEAPEAEESLSYQMPAFKLNKRILVYYAAWKEHVALYSFPSSIREFKKELTKYQTSKGTIKFPIDEKLPSALIRKLVKFRVKELGKK
jgi:uncharacterized protein YdhG (YjbR/CyaY superfamily)